MNNRQNRSHQPREWLIRFVPHSQVEAFKKDGWDISPLVCHHGVYSVIASKALEQSDV